MSTVESSTYAPPGDRGTPVELGARRNLAGSMLRARGGTHVDSSGAPFAERVTQLLDERGCTQRDLAAAAGVDPAHISRLLRRPDAGVNDAMLLRVAAALGVPPESFGEYRERRVVDAIHASPRLRDDLYGVLMARAEDVGDGPAARESRRFSAEALLHAPSQSEHDELPVPANGRFTRDEIIAAIHRWHELHGSAPKSIDWDPSTARRRGQSWRSERFESGEWPTLAMVRRQFGTMSNALHAAGLRPRPQPIRPRGQVLTRADILRAIQKWNRLYGEPPALADWAPARARRLNHHWRVQRYLAGDWPHLSTVLKRFGTLGAAIAEAGLDRRPPGRHIRGHGELHPDTHEAVARQLAAAADASCGPGLLATRVRAVAEARRAQDPAAIRGALIDLATAALSWADAISGIAPVQAELKKSA
jgi:transcriptional regulator with XRE-family HTH domain